jgi:DNA-binding beta-propeller fold protein YncE
MKRFCLACLVAFAPVVGAQSTDGPYKVLKAARVGGEGGWDYINADAVGRRLYIPRGGTPGMRATDSTPARAAGPGRIMVYNLDNLDSIGVVVGSGGQGAVVDPSSGHGFSSSRPAITMFDTKTLAVIKQIPIDSGFAPDGILFDRFNDRVYVFSHPTRDAMVIDTHDGAVLGRIALGGPPEQAVSDGHGKLYVMIQDTASVTVVDTKAMKAIGHFPFRDKGGCNGLTLDDKNHVLFAACSGAPRAGRGGPPPAAPGGAAQPTMTMLSARDGKVLATLPLAGGSDGMAFNPATMEAFSTGGGVLTVVKENGPTRFAVEENLPTMQGSRTIAFDSQTGHIFTMSQEREPAPAAPPPEAPGRGGRGRFSPPVPGSFTILMIGK